MSAAAGFVFRVVGIQDLVGSLRRAHREGNRAIEHAMRELLEGMRTYLLQRYIIGTRGSIPEEQLGTRSGRLRQSIGYSVRTRAASVEGRLGPQRVVYAAIHEFGGMAGRGHTVRIPARPYLSPTLEANREAIVKRLGDAYFATLAEARGGV